MNIEIVGINPLNKGARMMFDTIVKNCKFRFGNDTKIVVKLTLTLVGNLPRKKIYIKNYITENIILILVTSVFLYLQT